MFISDVEHLSLIVIKTQIVIKNFGELSKIDYN